MAKILGVITARAARLQTETELASEPGSEPKRRGKRLHGGLLDIVGDFWISRGIFRAVGAPGEEGALLTHCTPPSPAPAPRHERAGPPRDRVLQGPGPVPGGAVPVPASRSTPSSAC